MLMGETRCTMYINILFYFKVLYQYQICIITEEKVLLQRNL